MVAEAMARRARASSEACEAIAAILEDWGDAEVWAVAGAGVNAVGAASEEREAGEAGEGEGPQV